MDILVMPTFSLYLVIQILNRHREFLQVYSSTIPPPAETDHNIWCQQKKIDIARWYFIIQWSRAHQ